MEGTTKIKSGDFTAEPFLRAATGPFKSYFHGLLEDPWATQRLGIVIDNLQNPPQVTVDPTLTLALWNDFVDQATQHYRFGDPTWVVEAPSGTKNRAQVTPTSAKAFEGPGDRSAEPDLGGLILKQPERAKAIYETHKQDLLNWLAANRTEIVEFFATSYRTEGFQRDGEHWRETAAEVDSLRSQRDAIQTARYQKVRGWKAEIDAIWDSFESQINALALDKQTALAPIKVHRPFAQDQSKLRWINAFVPWFDLTVGVCLILGLFTRTAAILGAGFLASVILSQPPWVPGAAATQYQIVEFAAMLLIAVSVAGQIVGLDFFWSSRKTDRRVLE